MIRDARPEELPAIVALLADDVLGRHREEVVDPLPRSYQDASPPSTPIPAPA